MKTEITLLPLPQVEKRTGIKHSKIYTLIASGQFPTPVRLGKRSVRWRSDAIDSWIERITASTSGSRG
jgi:prophage regulatory protein